MTGIIGALDIEVTRLVAALENAESFELSGIEFSVGTLRSRRVVIGLCGAGKVNAAVCAQIMITRFGAEIIINTGVAGALSGLLKQGDIAVATAFIQHDIDTSTLGDPLGYISGIGMIELPCDPLLIANLYSLSSAKTDFFTISGVIATGDQFIDDESKAERIRKLFGACACEMEGGAIAQVCSMAGVRFCAIRCISDNADGSAGISYSEFAPMAAQRSAEIIIELVGRIK